MFFKLFEQKLLAKISRIVSLGLIFFQISNSSNLQARSFENQLERKIIENINFYLKKELPKNLTWEINLPEYLSYFEEESLERSNQKIRISILQGNKAGKNLIAQLKITDRNNHSKAVAVPIKIFEP